MHVSESPWVEKHKPTSIDEVIGDETTITKFKEFIKNKNIPHLLFCGISGTGKSTCAKILAKEITTEGNILYINASQEKGVDTIRNKVDSFCSMTSFGGLRVVILDEFDGMSRQAMETMRNTMEEYIDGSRFILTCNYEKKIIDPIKSRCQLFTFRSDEKLHKIATIKRCFEIIKKEEVSGENIKQDVIKIVNKCYPDIRKSINLLQKCTTNGVFKYNDNLEGDNTEARLIYLIQEMDIKAIRQEIIGSVDYNDLFKILFYSADKICPDKKVEIMLLVGDACRWHSMVVDPEINFITCLINICKECKGG
jgi:replication factor C small subunit